MSDYQVIDTEHDLIQALRDVTVGGYEVDVKFTNVRDRKGQLWPVIEVSNCTEPDVIIEGQYWFWDDGSVMQVL